MSVCLKGGRLIDPVNGRDEVADLLIYDGRIAGGSAQGPRRVIDVSGLVICPGLIDLRARVREPGAEHKATLASETAAALAGGVTTFCCPPDTSPPIDTAASAQWLNDRARALGGARVIPLGALTRELGGTTLADMAALMRAGCGGVSNGPRAIKDTRVLRHALEYAAGLGITVFLQPEDPWLAHQGVVHEGEVATRLGLAGIPATAETIALARDLMLIEQTGVRAHVMGLSAARSLPLLREAQARGVPVTADTAAHQLHLIDEDIGFFDTHCHVRPPLRAAADRAALREAVRDGTLSVICSDHQPHEPDAKRVVFSDSEPGISAFETLLPLTLRLAADGILPVTAALHRITAGPAAVLGLSNQGLAAGAVADLCVFDPDEEWTPSAQTWTSRGLNTPFLGQTLRGRVVMTLIGGEIRHQSRALPGSPQT
ncbi:MAG: dihydroorotase [Gammaproteobacteria bacterium]|nr:dihydroorotase [Gammaproteobacteria bacterium]